MTHQTNPSPAERIEKRKPGRAPATSRKPQNAHLVSNLERPWSAPNEPTGAPRQPTKQTQSTRRPPAIPAPTCYETGKTTRLTSGASYPGTRSRYQTNPPAPCASRQNKPNPRIDHQLSRRRRATKPANAHLASGASYIERPSSAPNEPTDALCASRQNKPNPRTDHQLSRHRRATRPAKRPVSPAARATQAPEVDTKRTHRRLAPADKTNPSARQIPAFPTPTSYETGKTTHLPSGAKYPGTRSRYQTNPPMHSAPADKTNPIRATIRSAAPEEWLRTNPKGLSETRMYAFPASFAPAPIAAANSSDTPPRLPHASAANRRSYAPRTRPPSPRSRGMTWKA
jgi:hypothetical protein